MSDKRSINGVAESAITADTELLYLGLLKEFYEKGNRERANHFAIQLEESLAASPEYAYSIRGEEIRSIIAELRDRYADAIQSRETEIRKILELHTRTIGTPHWEYVSKQYDFSDVSDRLDLLAILYDKKGEQDRAIQILIESKQFCLAHHIPFDAQDLLDELEQSQRDAANHDPGQGVSRESLDRAIRKVYKSFGESADEIVVTDKKSRQFTTSVNDLLPEHSKATIQDVRRRPLMLRRRGEARGGLPRLKRRHRLSQ